MSLANYWACAQLEANHERLALHCLALRGFETYTPRIRTKRVLATGKTVGRTVPLFVGYSFVWVELQWHAARWSPGVIRLVLDGERPARVPEAVITELRQRERNGLVELPAPPGLRRGDQVHIVRGVLAGLSGLYDRLRPHQRVAVLLAVLGRVELAKDDIAAVLAG